MKIAMAHSSTSENIALYHSFCRREEAEKMLALLRRREELDEVLKEKLAKKKEGKGEKVIVAYSSTVPYVQSITSIISRFIQ